MSSGQSADLLLRLISCMNAFSFKKANEMQDLTFVKKCVRKRDKIHY